jgi:hypothetical protein
LPNDLWVIAVGFHFLEDRPLVRGRHCADGLASAGLVARMTGGEPLVDPGTADSAANLRPELVAIMDCIAAAQRGDVESGGSGTSASIWLTTSARFAGLITLADKADSQVSMSTSWNEPTVDLKSSSSSLQLVGEDEVGFSARREP